jgi:hypothetical protein
MLKVELFSFKKCSNKQKEINKNEEFGKDLSYKFNWWSKYHASIDEEFEKKQKYEIVRKLK